MSLLEITLKLLMAVGLGGTCWPGKRIQSETSWFQDKHPYLYGLNHDDDSGWPSPP